MHMIPLLCQIVQGELFTPELSILMQIENLCNASNVRNVSNHEPQGTLMSARNRTTTEAALNPCVKGSPLAATIARRIASMVPIQLFV